MNYLIDTHVCLWALFEQEKLSANCRSLIKNPDNKILVSQVSLFEIAIKRQVQKLTDLKVNLAEIISEIYRLSFDLLPLRNEHIVSYFDNTFFASDHKDPFDRLLLAIADYEQMAFITKDEKFNAYKDRMSIIW